jgi:hypothetical protein
VVARPLLGSLHHDYQLDEKATQQDKWTRTAEVHNWVGYKLHLTETCEPGQPDLIT